jgi:Arc/MetJ-type ribon-helix-helix transcriptional regulator
MDSAQSTNTTRHGMVCGMATVKITVTLPEEQLEEIRGLVANGRAANISAFAKHAVAVALADASGWKEMLDEALQQTGGPLTKRERIWADTALTPKRERRKRKAA